MPESAAIELGINGLVRHRTVSRSDVSGRHPSSFSPGQIAEMEPESLLDYDISCELLDAAPFFFEVTPEYDFDIVEEAL